MGESTSAVATLPEVFGPDLLSEGIRERLRSLIEVLLRTELDAVLDAARHQRTDHRTGYRNGTKCRTLSTSFGQVELDVPRARLNRAEGASKEWESQLLPRYQRRTASLDETLLGLYFSGTNLRRIQRALEPLAAGALLGKNVISRLVRKLRGHLEAWRERSLKETSYVYLYLDATNLNVKILGRVRKVPVLIALGVRLDGQKEILAMEPQVREQEASWKEVLESLVKRGFNRPALVVIGLSAVPQDVARTGPESGSEPRGRRGRPVDVLRLPRGAVEEPAHDQPHRASEPGIQETGEDPGEPAESGVRGVALFRAVGLGPAPLQEDHRCGQDRR